MTRLRATASFLARRFISNRQGSSLCCDQSNVGENQAYPDSQEGCPGYKSTGQIGRLWKEFRLGLGRLGSEWRCSGVVKRGLGVGVDVGEKPCKLDLVREAFGKT